MPPCIHIALSFQQYFIHRKHTTQNRLKIHLDSKVLRKLQKHRTCVFVTAMLIWGACRSMPVLPSVYFLCWSNFETTFQVWKCYRYLLASDFLWQEDMMGYFWKRIMQYFWFRVLWLCGAKDYRLSWGQICMHTRYWVRSTRIAVTAKTKWVM